MNTVMTRRQGPASRDAALQRALTALPQHQQDCVAGMALLLCSKIPGLDYMDSLEVLAKLGMFLDARNGHEGDSPTCARGADRVQSA